jgi:nuclear GTP-binding protein
MSNIGKSSAKSSAKHRAKVEKALATTSKSMRKLAKANPSTRTKLKKDPGVPKLFPFKEKMLKEIEQSRKNLEEERRKRKAGEGMHVEGILGLVQRAEERGEEFEEMGVDGEDDDQVEVSIRRETSRKAYNKEFKKVIEQADVVLYVLDARDPESTRSKEIEQLIREYPNGEKQLIFILNKIGTTPQKFILTKT